MPFVGEKQEQNHVDMLERYLFVAIPKVGYDIGISHHCAELIIPFLYALIPTLATGYNRSWLLVEFISYLLSMDELVFAVVIIVAVILDLLNHESVTNDNKTAAIAVVEQ